MKTAEDFLRQYAKGKPLELFIRDGGGELANNSRHIADVMEAYKEHCTKSENLPVSHAIERFSGENLMKLQKHFASLYGNDEMAKEKANSFAVGFGKACELMIKELNAL